MDDGDLLGVSLDFWDDAVGAFEPVKVLRQLRLTFPGAEIDPTDHQQARLLRELDFWSRAESDVREELIRGSWGLYRTTGPTYRFVVPFPSGHRVSGGARRLSVYFWVPPDLPAEHRERLLTFLRSLQMGEPKLVTEDEEGPGAAPDALPG